jgi:nicotinamide mononucleotide transporter
MLSTNMAYDEILGTLFGLLSVILTVRQSVWCWPTGLVSVVFVALTACRTQLYAQAGLQVFFFVVSIYGWYEWTHPGKGRQELPVTRTPRVQAVLLTALTGVAAGVLVWLLARHTDDALPLLDSVTTAMSLAAQWMLARKLLESWLVWIAVDVLSIGMFLARGIYPYAFLYLGFLVLATAGYREWMKSLKSTQPA